MLEEDKEFKADQTEQEGANSPAHDPVNTELDEPSLVPGSNWEEIKQEQLRSPAGTASTPAEAANPAVSEAKEALDTTAAKSTTNQPPKFDKSELAKATHRALWAREVKESLLSKDGDRALRTLSSIAPDDMSKVREQYHKLYNSTMLEAVESGLGDDPQKFNRALFILEGKPEVAHAIALEDAITSDTDVVRSVQEILEQAGDPASVKEAFEKISGQDLDAALSKNLNETDRIITRSLIEGDHATASTVWLQSELNAEQIDPTTLEEICVSGALEHPDQRAQSYQEITGEALQDTVERIPEGLMKQEIKAILGNKFTQAHALRVGRLLRSQNPNINTEEVHDQITQLLVLYSMQESNTLFKRYREEFDASLHDDVVAFLNEAAESKKNLQSVKEYSSHEIEVILKALNNSEERARALELLKRMSQQDLLELDARLRAENDQGLRDLIKKHLRGSLRFDIELALQGVPETLEEEHLLVNARHEYERRGLNILSAKLMDTYSSRGSLLDESLDRVNSHFDKKISRTENLQAEEEAQFLALVDLVDADIEAYREFKASKANSHAKSSSYIAALLCFVGVETLDYYIDNVSPSVFVSISVAVMMGIVAESVIQPYLRNRLVNAEKLVERVQRKRGKLTRKHPTRKELRNRQKGIYPKNHFRNRKKK